MVCCVEQAWFWNIIAVLKKNVSNVAQTMLFSVVIPCMFVWSDVSEEPSALVFRWWSLKWLGAGHVSITYTNVITSLANQDYSLRHFFDVTGLSTALFKSLLPRQHTDALGKE